MRKDVSTKLRMSADRSRKTFASTLKPKYRRDRAIAATKPTSKNERRPKIFNEEVVGALGTFLLCLGHCRPNLSGISRRLKFKTSRRQLTPINTCRACRKRIPIKLQNWRSDLC